MDDYLAGWSDFNVAMIGATAALAGLVIVASSVNIEVIVKAGHLTARLASGIVGLTLAIAASAIGLIPHVAPVVYGAVVIVAALIAGAVAVIATRSIYTNRNPANHLKPLRAAVGFLSPLAYLVGGILLFVSPPAGLIWLAAGAIAAIAASLMISWVALVEVLR
jgi:hypothetical protein